MDFDPVFLSRLQFGFVITFHIIFPSFTIGLGAWLATIEGARLATGNPIYRRVFDFWLKVFALSFGMGVVTGIVMAFQFGTNWSVLAERTGSIQGPLLGYEAFTAFMLEATFFGVMLLGRDRVSPRVYFFACCMVSLGTMFSSFWILANNSWMQVPIGHSIVDGKIIPAGLASNRAGADSDGALATHAACRVPDKCDDHCRHRRLLLAARRSSAGRPGDAALEPWIGGSVDPDPALLRTSDR
jgi:cytochrome bd-type quinol oxidase subunit 1